MKKLLLLLFGASVLHAQNEPNLLFSNTENNTNYGGAINTALSAKDVLGNTYLVGTFSNLADFNSSSAEDNISSIGSSDLFVTVYDNNGNYVSTRNIGGTGDINPTAIAIAGGFLHLAGNYTNTIDFDPSVQVVNLTSTNPNGSGFIAKYDLNGNYVAAKSIDGTGLIIINDMKFFNNEIVITGGFTLSMDFDPSASSLNLTSNGAKDIFIAKYSASLLLASAISFGGTEDDTAYSAAFDSTGTIIVSGNYSNTVDFDALSGNTSLTSTPSVWNSFIVKYSNNFLFQWVKDIGGSSNIISGNSSKLVLDSNANILITGTYSLNSDFDPSGATAVLTAVTSTTFLAKYDANGNYTWAKKLAGTSSVVSKNIAIDSSNNVNIIGSFNQTADFDLNSGIFNLTASNGSNYFAKYDNNGSFIYAHNLFASINTLLVDSNNSLLLSGTFNGTRDFDPSAGIATLASTSTNVFLAKYSSNISYIFAKAIGGDKPSNTTTNFIASDGSGNVYRAGLLSAVTDLDPSANVSNLSSISSRGIFLAKYTASGSFIWSKSFSAAVASSLTISIMNTDSNGNTYIIGRFLGTVDFDPSSNTANLTSNNGTIFDLFMAKYDSNGNYIWAKQLSGNLGAGAKRMVFDTSGNFYFTGRFSGTNAIDFDPSPSTALYIPVGAIESFIAKYSPSGDYIWTKVISGVDGSSGMNETHIDLKGSNIYLTGFFGGSFKFNPATNDVISTVNIAGFVAKYDLNGNYQFAACLLPNSNDSSTITLNVTSDENNNFYLLTRLDGSADFDLLPNTTSLVTSPFIGSDKITSYVISKYTASGTLLWAKSLVQNSLDTGIGQNTAHSYTINNEYILAFDYYGTIASGIDLDPSTSNFIVNGNTSKANIIIAKYNATSGNFIWGNKIDGAYNAVLNSTNLDSNANLLMSGYFSGIADFDFSASVQNKSSISPYNFDRFWAKYVINTLGIDENINKKGYVIFPNPTNSILFVSHTLFDEFKITLIDVTGKILQEATLTNQKGVDVSMFPSGLYFIQIENELEKSTYKFIKN